MITQTPTSIGPTPTSLPTFLTEGSGLGIIAVFTAVALLAVSSHYNRTLDHKFGRLAPAHSTGLRILIAVLVGLVLTGWALTLMYLTK